jgi:UDP-N-acetylglucosamine 2-epimerase
MPYSHYAYDNLIHEGMPENRTFITGSPMKEVIDKYRDKIESSDVLDQLGLKKDGYIVMSSHREENVDIESKFNRLFPALNKIADKYKLPVIFSVHPRTRKKLDERGFKMSKYIREEKPFGFFEYIKLQENAFCVLSDSGYLNRRVFNFGFPRRSYSDFHGTPRRPHPWIDRIQGGVDFDSD